MFLPGGGPGSEEDHGYPPWTAQRTEAALKVWRDECRPTSGDGAVCAFLCLSAGSMNAPPPRSDTVRWMRR